jgi:hypothetical protein
VKRALLIAALAGHAMAGDWPTPGTLFYGNAYPEASAAVVLGNPATWLMMADNEIPAPAVYQIRRLSLERSSATLRTAATPTLEVNDLEGSTIFPWDINGDGQPEATYTVWTASSSRSKSKGRVSSERDAFFAMAVDEPALRAGTGTAFPKPENVEINRTVREQLRSLGSTHSATPWGAALRDSAWRTGTSATEADPSLAGEAGLNIEGLSISADGKALVFGLRSPLVDGKAMLVPLTNPIAALGLGESAPQPASFAEPILLDLGGRGFRSIEWDATRRAYLIAAGPAGQGASFALFTWSGDPAAPAVRVTTPSAKTAETIDP